MRIVLPTCRLEPVVTVVMTCLTLTSCRGLPSGGPHLGSAPAGRAPSEAAAEAPQSVTSTYERGPTPEWSTLALGRPATGVPSLFQGVGLGPGCATLPSDVSRMLSGPLASPAEPLFEIDLAILDLEIGVSRAYTRFGAGLGQERHLTGQYVAATGASADGQGSGCGSPSPLYVRVGSLGSARVSVLR